MNDRSDVGGGISVLDGAALVMGAAVASVHVRTAVPEFDDFLDWVWAGALFSWLAATSAGPFVYLVRRFATRPAGYPRSGDRLWALVGLPWIFSAMVRTAQPSREITPGVLDPAYEICLGVGLGVSAIIVVAVLVRRYLRADPTRPAPIGPTPWTHHLGLLLAIAWPIHCGVGLVVMS